MAERRMVLRSFVISDAFTSLTANSQALYFQILVNADDDGFVGNIKGLLRLAGRSAKSLKELEAAGFVILFKSGIAVIRHWRQHNKIRRDRYKASIYVDEKAQLFCYNDVYQLKTDLPPDASRAAGREPQDINQPAAQYSLGKYSNSVGKVMSVDMPACGVIETLQYAENVTMTEAEYGMLVEKLGNEEAVKECIEMLDNYKGSSGKKYKSDYRAILNWVVDRYKEKHARAKQRAAAMGVSAEESNDVTSAAEKVTKMLAAGGELFE